MKFHLVYGKISPELPRNRVVTYIVLSRSGQVDPNSPLTIIPQKDLFIRNGCISFNLKVTSMKPIKLFLEYIPHESTDAVEVTVATFVIYHVLRLSGGHRTIQLIPLYFQAEQHRFNLDLRMGQKYTFRVEGENSIHIVGSFDDDGMLIGLTIARYNNEFYLAA